MIKSPLKEYLFVAMVIIINFCICLLVKEVLFLISQYTLLTEDEIFH